MTARYDSIGVGYSRTRHEDPEISRRIVEALADSRSVLNVGAGAGSYEPADLDVVAVEPSAVMVDQRPHNAAPAILATAGALPVRSRAFDAALAVLTVHHWDGAVETGVRELRRVARGPVIVVTFDPEVSGQMWVCRDYMPEAAELDMATFPSIDDLTRWLGGSVSVTPLLTPSDTPDWTFASFWAHPERVLDPGARQGTSGFARMRPDVIDRVVTAVAADLADGTWDRQHGHLRDLHQFDAGMRLLVAC